MTVLKATALGLERLKFRNAITTKAGQFSKCKPSAADSVVEDKLYFLCSVWRFASLLGNKLCSSEWHNLSNSVNLHYFLSLSTWPPSCFKLFMSGRRW